LTRTLSIFLILLPSFGTLAQAKSGAPAPNDYLFNDTHFHLTNYVQEGTDIRDFLKIMGDKAGRVALFGIPLQQQWSFALMAIAHQPTT
jgi:hypothetical protein